jgi:hypothetical protein
MPRKKRGPDAWRTRRDSDPELNSPEAKAIEAKIEAAYQRIRRERRYTVDPWAQRSWSSRFPGADL